jgi:hypothetical protein
MTHRATNRGQSNRCQPTRFGKRVARLGQGLEQIESRIMLAGDTIDALPVVLDKPVEFSNTRTVQGGYIDLSAEFSDYALQFSFTGKPAILNYSSTKSYDSFGQTNNLEVGVLGSAVSSFGNAFSTRAITPQVWLQQPVITLASEGGYALIPLGPVATPAPDAISPGARDAIATGLATPLTGPGRSTLGSDAPLEAARGRSQAFELSMSVRESAVATPVVNARAVDAAIAQWSRPQSIQAQPTITAATETGSQDSVDDLLAAARKVEAKLSETRPLAVEVAVTRPATSETTALALGRIEASDALPTESLLATESRPPVDADTARRSLLTGLFDFDKESLTDMPGVWLFTVVVTVTGLYWQKSGAASHRFAARENEMPEPRLRRMTVAGRRAG